MPRTKLTRLPLGTRVRFDRMIVRGEADYNSIRRWLNPAYLPRHKRIGIVVGYRTKRDGYTRYNGPDEQREFITTGTRIVVLVALNLDHAPVNVDPADVEVLP